MKTLHLVATGLLLQSVLIGCGKEDDSKDENVASQELTAVGDDTIHESIYMNLSDALTSLSDSNVTANSASLSLTQERIVSFDKSCSEIEEDAQVTITSERNGEKTYSGIIFESTYSFQGSGEKIRTWSREDGAVNCHENGIHADIDLTSSDIAGLSLDVQFDRSRNWSMSQTNKNNGQERSRTVSFEASGTRSVLWTDHQDLDDGTFLRSKSIQSQAERTRTFKTASMEEEKTISLSIESDAEAPLVVSTIRDSSTLALLSKEIVSGKLTSTSDAGNQLIVEFSNYKREFSSSSCLVTSGSVTASYYQSGSEDPLKVIQIDITDGVVDAKDVTDAENHEEILNFDIEPCEISDFS
ncbi:MAG: hypothetical protein HRU19_10030 [Pseudobacteriovorax sp.]|nr:hypothetical protein [Pseudobacteriovorax sp.]